MMDATARFSLNPKWMLRIEGLAVFVSAILLFAVQSGEWLAFFLLLLFPDLALIPYMLNKRLGIMVYNILHTYISPIILILLSLAAGWHTGVSLGIIWLAHIGADRMFGYGLKYSALEGIKDTHLQKV